MIEPSHLLQHIIRPVLKDLDLWSEPAERLLLGTACQESQCGRYLVQLGGPALGIFHMEPATHDDIWVNYLGDHSKNHIAKHAASRMIWDLWYATAMCRVHYLRVKAPIPDNLPAQAGYWKLHYNTPLGKGTEDDYIRAWYRFIGHATF